MSYTVYDTSASTSSATVVSTVTDALALARSVEREGGREPIIAGGDGWILTLDELEELAKS